MKKFLYVSVFGMAFFSLSASHNQSPIVVKYQKVSPLLMVARTGYAEIVKMLLFTGAKISPGGLIEVMESGHSECVDLIVQAGAVTGVTASALNERVLVWAAQGDHVEIVKMILMTGVKMSQSSLEEIVEHGSHKESLYHILEAGVVTEVGN